MAGLSRIGYPVNVAPRRNHPRPEPTALALRIRAARLHTKLSQPELALRAHLANGRTVWRFEVEARVPDAEELAAIADACDADPGWLLTGAHAPEWFDEDAARRSLDGEDDAKPEAAA